ncbi:MAG: hypothetical protein JWR60_1250 [Polaromonas sp.]|nr:hypothetical protein [Polaromonas sp.]
MLLPPSTDLAALLGIDLVLCAGCLRLLAIRQRGSVGWKKWLIALIFVLLWLPVGAAHLPLLAYVRGISSDLSTTLVAMACLGAWRRLSGRPRMARRESLAVYMAVAVAAVLLYPLALGWGDWDAYRLGWGSFGLWTGLLALALVAWVNGLRLLPWLVSLALLAWSMGLMESGNLWDYLIDPWLSIAALAQCLNTGTQRLLQRLRPTGSAGRQALKP